MANGATTAPYCILGAGAPTFMEAGPPTGPPCLPDGGGGAANCCCCAWLKDCGCVCCMSHADRDKDATGTLRFAAGVLGDEDVCGPC